MKLTSDTVLDAGTHRLTEGIEILKDGITLDGNGATIIGNNRSGKGIFLHDRKNVTIKNLTIIEFNHGIYAESCSNIILDKILVTSTAEIAHNTIFLNIFHQQCEYAGGICLVDVADSLIQNCNLSHQFCGLLAYNSCNLKIKANNANYSSGFGFYLSNTNDSVLENNYADFCCRWHTNEGSGHMGADAAGFVIVNGSSNNTFIHNFARLGGDGFFLAGLRHDGTFAPCNDNLFQKNDASWSPNISFEATFSSRNIFRENIAQNSNYGFWLGFSRNNILENNQINNNRQAGIAVENGIDMEASNNQLIGNGHGILLWSKRIPQFKSAVPENDTSRNWKISRNEFTANGIAIKIVADHDHGTRPFTQYGRTPPPTNHRLTNNKFTRNSHDVIEEGVKP
jgi:parallel beta-helix repeat protein